MNLYFQDESRFGLHTKYGRGLTAKGIQPVCSFQQVFQSTYVYGAASPIDGSHLFLELPKCDGDCFQIFLNHLAQNRPQEFKLMVLDNGAFHKASKLLIPQNIALLFLPPYAPELNPIEKIWARFKRAFTNQFFHNMDHVSDFIATQCKLLPLEVITSTCRMKYLFLDNYWTI